MAKPLLQKRMPSTLATHEAVSIKLQRYRQKTLSEPQVSQEIAGVLLEFPFGETPRANTDLVHVPAIILTFGILHASAKPHLRHGRVVGAHAMKSCYQDNRLSAHVEIV